MENNVDYCIKKTNILLVEVKSFTHIVGFTLAEENLSDEERFRKVLFYNHMFIDMETGDILEEIWDKDGNVKKPIFANTKYIANTYLYPEPTDEDLILAANFYEEAIRKKKLLAEKKLINFPKKRLY